MKLLTVDDSKMVHMLVKKALASYAIEVVTAGNGKEGVEKATAENPDLILMDVNMPEMDGLEALAALRAQPETAGIPVMLLTADGAAQSMEQAFESGVTKYLTKPFDEPTLVTAVETILVLEKKA